jgi:hypothetical protein
MPSGEVPCGLFRREIVRPVEISNESGWAPSHSSLGLRARADKVASNEHPYRAKVGCCLLGDFEHDQHLQAAADGISDVPNRHSLFGDRVIPRASFPGLRISPKITSSSPQRKSSPGGNTDATGATGAKMRMEGPCRSVRSCGITASAPSGMGAPVVTGRATPNTSADSPNSANTCPAPGRSIGPVLRCRRAPTRSRCVTIRR